MKVGSDEKEETERKRGREEKERKFEGRRERGSETCKIPRGCTYTALHDVLKHNVDDVLRTDRPYCVV
jgi:hypothetical protein